MLDRIGEGDTEPQCLNFVAPDFRTGESGGYCPSFDIVGMFFRRRENYVDPNHPR